MLMLMINLIITKITHKYKMSDFLPQNTIYETPPSKHIKVQYWLVRTQWNMKLKISDDYL